MAAVFIDPRPQYTNVGANSAAVRSRFTFFESGTNDPKPVFADSGKVTAISNVQLTNDRGELAAVYFDGVARVTREDELTSGFKQRYDIDPVEGSGSASTFQQWSSEVTYSIGDVVQASDTNLYQSKTNNNLNNDPVLDVTEINWKPLLGLTPLDPYSETLKAEADDATISANEGNEQERTPTVNVEYDYADFVSGGSNRTVLTIDNTAGITVTFNAGFVIKGGTAPTIGTEIHRVIMDSPDDGTTKFLTDIGIYS